LEIGADGFLTIRPADGGAENKMRYFVEDGSTLVMVQKNDQTMTTGVKVFDNDKWLTIDPLEEDKNQPQRFFERIK
jgi:hypothetical protein